jgi:tetratricopeptide (TPR) repeat protein
MLRYNAFEVLKDAMSIDDKNAEVYFLIGQVYYQKGLYDNAVKWCDKSLAIDPAFKYALFTRVYR